MTTATNLRLRPDAAEAVRAEAERSGRSQQDVIRTAIDRDLGLGAGSETTRSRAALLTAGVKPPRTPYAAPTTRVVLAPGVTTRALLDRTDRV
jgi:hypothetical protein